MSSKLGLFAQLLDIPRSRWLICVGLIVSGCSFAIAPFPEYAKGWVGASIDELLVAKKRPQSYASRTNFPQRFYELENGNQVFVSAEGEDCIVHWEFNRERTIVGYKTEGDKCH